MQSQSSDGRSVLHLSFCHDDVARSSAARFSPLLADFYAVTLLLGKRERGTVRRIAMSKLGVEPNSFFGYFANDDTRWPTSIFQPSFLRRVNYASKDRAKVSDGRTPFSANHQTVTLQCYNLNIIISYSV